MVHEAATPTYTSTIFLDETMKHSSNTSFFMSATIGSSIAFIPYFLACSLFAMAASQSQNRIQLYVMKNKYKNK